MYSIGMCTIILCTVPFISHTTRFPAQYDRPGLRNALADVFPVPNDPVLRKNPMLDARGSHRKSIVARRSIAL